MELSPWKAWVVYHARRVRSWLYWRQFEQPGRTVAEQLAFARRNLGLPREEARG